MNVNLEKYEKYVLEGLNKENMSKILELLIMNNCDYIDDLVENYLDIFAFDYEDFKNRFNKLNQKYNNDLINQIRNDMNIIEEFYNED